MKSAYLFLFLKSNKAILNIFDLTVGSLSGLRIPSVATPPEPIGMMGTEASSVSKNITFLWP